MSKSAVLDFKMAANLQKHIINHIMNTKMPVLQANRPKKSSASAQLLGITWLEVGIGRFRQKLARERMKIPPFPKRARISKQRRL